MGGIKLDTDVKRAVAINQCPLQLCESHICPNGPSLCYPTGQPTDNIGPHLHPNTFLWDPSCIDLDLYSLQIVLESPTQSNWVWTMCLTSSNYIN